MLILSEKEVQNLIDIEELIAALEQAHIQYSKGKAVMPVRLVVPLNEIQGRITSMPGYLSRDQALGMKVVTYFQNNPTRGLPAILARIILFSAETGIMDGSFITAIRTACASAMATKALANPVTPTLGILGAGVQARAHIRALSRVRQLSKIKIYSPSGTSGENLRKEIEPEEKVTIEVAESAEAAVRDADLVVTATTAKTPILNAESLRPGTPVNAVGSHRPDLRRSPARLWLAPKSSSIPARRSWPNAEIFSSRSRRSPSVSWTSTVRSVRFSRGPNLEEPLRAS